MNDFLVALVLFCIFMTLLTFLALLDRTLTRMIKMVKMMDEILSSLHDVVGSVNVIDKNFKIYYNGEGKEHK